MGNIFRICVAAYLIYWLGFLGFGAAYAGAARNFGSGVVMGSLRGGSLGRVSGATATLGRAGLSASYNQGVGLPSANDPYPAPSNDPNGYPRKVNMPVKAKTPPSGVGKAIKGLLKSPAGRANALGLVAMLGLEMAMQKAGLFPDEDDIWYIPDDGWRKIKPAPFVRITDWRNPRNEYDSIHGACASYGVDYQGNFNKDGSTHSGGGCCRTSCSPAGAGYNYSQGEQCRFPYKMMYGVCGTEKEPVKIPATDAQIEAIDLGTWVPPVNVPKEAIDPILPYISPSDTTIEVAPIVIDHPSQITTAPDGTVQERKRRDTVSIRNPNTDPAVVISTETTTTTHKDGQLTGTETTTTTTDATGATPTEQTAPTEQEQKLDCELVPTLCQTQKEQLEQDKKRDEWLKEPVPDEPDLGDLAPRDIGDLKKDYQINFGSKTCPSALSLQFSSFGKTASFDFTFICDFAVKFRLILLAIAYLIAARILVGALK